MNDIPSKLKNIRSRGHRAVVGFLLAALVTLGNMYTFIANLTPRRALFPVAIIQVGLAMLAIRVGGTRGIYVFAVGSLFLVGLALSPTSLRSKETKAHWVRESEIKKVNDRL